LLGGKRKNFRSFFLKNKRTEVIFTKQKKDREKRVKHTHAKFGKYSFVKFMDLLQKEKKCAAFFVVRFRGS
jgi:hypothetical protein